MKKLTEEQLFLAKSQYMDYTPITKIASNLSINEDAIQWHVRGKWKAERTLLENEVISEFGATRVSKINLLSKYSADIITKALKSLHERDKPPSMLEARAAINIFESLDKIMRLDKGDPTEIIKEMKPMSLIELRKAVDKLDPFHEEPEEIEYEEPTD